MGSMWEQKAVAFVRKYQGSFPELKEDGKAGDKTFAHLANLVGEQPEPDKPINVDAFAGWVNCLPRLADGSPPIMSSGFVDNDGNGPNQDRFRATGRGHLGNDWLYRWDREGDPPPTLFERFFYCPAVPVYAMGPGVVEYAKLLDVSKKWGGPRWAVKINHGLIPGFGHCVSWSTHHASVTVNAGDEVEATTQIAVAGDTGSEGSPHVHMELWRWQPGETVDRWSAPIDPYPLMRGFRVLDFSE